MKRIITVLTIISIALIAYLSYTNIFKSNPDHSPVNAVKNLLEIDENSTQPEEESNTEKSIDTLQTTAWIPYWDFDSGLETLQANPDSFETILPVIYSLNADGSLNIRNSQFKELQEYAKVNEIKFIPSIGMFNHDDFTKVLQEEENYARQISSITTAIEDNRFDGIDLDYESIKLSDKTKYEQFIQELHTEIGALEQKEDREITLSITVLSKWGDNIPYPSLKETRQAQDWTYLSKYADELRIMAYDYSNQYQADPGPIAPLPWVNLILQEAIKKVPKEKIFLGVHNYGYNWAASELNVLKDLIPKTPSDKLSADAYTYDQIIDIKNTYSGEDFEIELWGERYYKYKRNGGDRILVYMNQSNIEERKNLAQDFQIEGISLWRLGGDSHLDY